MESVVIIFGVVAFFAVLAGIACAVEENWKWVGLWAGVLGVSAAILLPASISMNNANAERIAERRAACYEAGYTWAHDAEKCITDDGWTVNVR